MLREVKNGAFEARGAWFWKRHAFVAGRAESEDGLSSAELAAAERLQQTTAVRLLDTGERAYWWCLGRFWWEDDDLAAADVYALAYERRRRRERALQRARAVVATDAPPSATRQPIPVEVRRAVFERDGGRCVECGAAFDLQYDHVIPVALGGSGTAENLELLCAPCNRRKGATVG